MFVNPDTYLIDYVWFTFRQVDLNGDGAIRFSDFQEVGDFVFPFSNSFSLGEPGKEWLDIQSNNFLEVRIGAELN